MALSLDLTASFDESEISNDGRLSGNRHSPWADSLAEIATAVIDGELASGKFVKLAQFGASSGARARQKQLTTDGKALPMAEAGKFSFKPNTWVGPAEADGTQKRHSTLWAAFTLVAPAVVVEDVEEEFLTDEDIDGIEPETV